MRFDCIHCRKATTKPQSVKGAFLRMLTLGRPIGSKNKSHKLEGMQLTIKALIENGMSKTQIAQKTGVSRSTLYLFLKSF